MQILFVKEDVGSICLNDAGRFDATRQEDASEVNAPVAFCASQIDVYLLRLGAARFAGQQREHASSSIDYLAIQPREAWR